MVQRYFPKDTSHLVSEEDSAWVEALRAVDESGDKVPLLELLVGDTPISPSARWHLADLLDRYKLATQASRGRKRTPSYDLPPAQIKLERARRYHEHLINTGMSVDESVQKASAACDVKEATFRALLAGKYSAARRVRRRRPPGSRP